MLWINTTTKYQCLIRQGFGRILCGYVGVDRNHRLYGRPTDDDALDGIRVHGGLTFAGRWPEINNLWYFGFDCGHFTDIIPEWPISSKPIQAIKTTLRLHYLEQTHKDLNFVVAEVESLAHQLKGLE